MNVVVERNYGKGDMMKINTKLNEKRVKEAKSFGQVFRKKNLLFLRLPSSVNPLFQVAHYVEFYRMEKVGRSYG
jgi:hypothetical protein